MVELRQCGRGRGQEERAAPPTADAGAGVFEGEINHGSSVESQDLRDDQSSDHGNTEGGGAALTGALRPKWQDPANCWNERERVRRWR
jgi:hypothetical protein